MTQNYTRINIATSVEAARFDEKDNETYAHEQTSPDFAELTEAFPPTPEVVEDEESVTFFESYADTVNEWRCDEQAWSCERSDAVAAEAKKCVASPANAPSPADACHKAACDRAQHRPWPAVIKERKAATNAQRRCHASAPNSESEYGCQIAYANACTGLVGLVCSGRAFREKKERTRVEEYLFLPVIPVMPVMPVMPALPSRR
jgi:hypothetical protein